MFHSRAGRRLAARRAFRHRLVAIRNSQVERGAPLEPGQALPGGQQRVLQGVLGVGEGPEHPVAVHLQLPVVRLGQLPERLAVPGPRSRDQVGCHHLQVDTGEGANWAAQAT
jgi:hypothetical protein